MPSKIAFFSQITNVQIDTLKVLCEQPCSLGDALKNTYKQTQFPSVVSKCYANALEIILLITSGLSFIAGLAFFIQKLLLKYEISEATVGTLLEEQENNPPLGVPIERQTRTARENRAAQDLAPYGRAQYDTFVDPTNDTGDAPAFTI